MKPDRSFTANLLGTLAGTINDRVVIGLRQASGHGGNAPAALTTLLWYPDRPIAFLADRLRISHPGAVQLSERLESEGLIDRIPGDDGRTRLLVLTPLGARVAHSVLAERRAVLDRAIGTLADDEIAAFDQALSKMLEALTDNLLTGEFMCRLCDELACPDGRCPVERVEPAPPYRRGTGYGV